MLALMGTIQGNTIIIENDNITNYDGKEVILTIHDQPYRKAMKKIDWSVYESLCKTESEISNAVNYMWNLSLDLFK